MQINLQRIAKLAAGIMGTKECSNLPRQIASIIEKHLGIELNQGRGEHPNFRSPQSAGQPEVDLRFRSSDLPEDFPILRAFVLGYWEPAGGGKASRSSLPILYGMEEVWNTGDKSEWEELARKYNDVFVGRSILAGASSGSPPPDFLTLSFVKVLVDFSNTVPHDSIQKTWEKILKDVGRVVLSHAKDPDSLVWLSGEPYESGPEELVRFWGREPFTEGVFSVAIAVVED